MRLTRLELLEKFPYWNETKHDIVKAFYGDIPLIKWDNEYYNWYSKLDGTLANLQAVEAYIYSVNGDYNIYRTLNGEIKVKTDGTILCGDFKVKYRGVYYDIVLNLMYGLNSLTILKLHGDKVKGWCNKDGIGSPSNSSRTEELDVEIIDKILNSDIKDFGECVHSFFNKCKDVYEKDNENYILQKTFNLH